MKKPLTYEQKIFVKKNISMIESFMDKEEKIKKLNEEEKDELKSWLFESICYSSQKFEVEKGFKPSTYIWGGFNLTLNNFLVNSKKDSRTAYTDGDLIIDYVDKNIKKNKNALESEKIFDLIDNTEILLSDKEKKMLSLYYVKGINSFKKIADVTGYSKERIRQIVVRGINKIRRYVNEENVEIEDFYVT